MQQPRRTTGNSVTIALCSALTAAVLGLVAVRWPIDPEPIPGGAIQDRIYRFETSWLLALLAGAAVVGLLWRRARLAGALLAGGFALGLGGTGAVAARRWNTSKGFGAAAGNLSELRVLAVALAVVALGAAIACLLVVLRSQPPARDVAAGVQLATGALIVVVVPLVMGSEFSNSRTTQVGAHALMYAIPWGVTIAVGAFTTPTLRRVALAVPLLAGPFLVFDRPMIPGRDVSLGYLAAVVLVGVCGATQLIVPARNAVDPRQGLLS